MILATSMIANASPCLASHDEEEPKQVNPQHIVVRNESPNFHRSLEPSIYAYYADGTITLDFIENLGVVTMAIQNLTTGGQVADLIDTSTGNVIIDIDSILTVGNYDMTITTMSGDVYYAEFTLE